MVDENEEVLQEIEEETGIIYEELLDEKIEQKDVCEENGVGLEEEEVEGGNVILADKKNFGLFNKDCLAFERKEELDI